MRQRADEAGEIVVIGTGGTIAGEAASSVDNRGYRAARRPIESLLEGLPRPLGWTLRTEQLVQIDSKDMDADTWQALARRVQQTFDSGAARAVVITHGTDTLEETAWFLQRVLRPGGPVVLTAAMRPATSLLADGPQNLADAVAVARHAALEGHCAVFGVVAGRLFGAVGVRKSHPSRLDAFGGGDEGALGEVADGEVRWWRAAPPLAPLSDRSREAALHRSAAAWPRVAVVSSHAAADGGEVDALLDAGWRGLVIAGTGGATVHQRIEAALARRGAWDWAEGVEPPPSRERPWVWRASRCGDGVAGTVPAGVAGVGAGPRGLTPWQARVELQLQLLGEAE